MKIFIPIKEKSQRVLGKNFRIFNGLPLYQHVILKFSEYFEVYIDTDSDEILQWCDEQYSNIFGYKRKEKNIGHNVSVTDLISDFITDNNIENEQICQLHVTSPLLEVKTIMVASNNKDYTNIVGCDKIYGRFWKEDNNLNNIIEPVNHNPNELIQTQDLDPLYLENSSFYIFNSNEFMKTKRRICDNPLFYEVSYPQNLDIDTEDDWDLIKKYETSINETEYVSHLVNTLYNKIIIKDNNPPYIGNIKDNLNNEILYTKSIIDTTKLFTFIMPIKNRSERAVQSIKSIVSIENLRYIDFMIVEDTSDNLMEIPTNYTDLIDYNLVDSNQNWTKTKLVNFGVKRSITPLCVIWDVDFIFPNNFVDQLINTISKLDINNQYFAIPSYETHDTVIRNGKYKQGDPYGNIWIYPRKSIIQVRGMNENMCNWGHEERELELKFDKLTDLKPVYIHNINKKLMVFHHSHNDKLRAPYEKLNEEFLKKIEMNERWGELEKLN